MSSLDAHARPPEAIRSIYKQYQKLPKDEIDKDEGMVDFHRDEAATHFSLLRTIDSTSLSFDATQCAGRNSSAPRVASVYGTERLPGLHVVPALIPPDVQLELLDRLLHRDLANNKHQTNLHKFYDIPYDLTRPPDATGPGTSRQASFFNAESSSVPTFDPLDPSIHKPLSISQVLHKKLRWMTLGGQYDWTNKVYPDEKPPDFPQDVADVVSTAFPDMKPEAAIVNVYSPGDTLSLHRDVSEHCDEGLVSISLGCEAIFVVGLAEEGAGSGQCLAIRLRSGDAVYMSGLSRYAWHGVPSIIPNSCPEHLASWPARASNEHDTGATSTPELFPSWKGWMQNKRINLNVRQIKP